MLDQFLNRRFDNSNYNCSHFVRDIWLHLTGIDLTGMACAWNKGELPQAMARRNDIVRLECPQSPCIVMFQRPGDCPHCGVWIDGKVLHLTDKGARFDEFEFVSIGFKRWNFYRC